MEPIVVLVIALIGVVIAWKVLKGIAKTLVLVAILALGAYLAFSGVLN